ncbi:MAG TPA: hypothetical protein VK325_06070, partial [Pseudoxanthomonas sp.]|nr:hypothetical protein [Pseudoxanthomonas sp.]
RPRTPAPATAPATAIAAPPSPSPVPGGSPAPGTTVAQVQSLDRFQAEQERLRKLLENQPKAYQDKVMDPSALPPLPEEQSVASMAQGFRGYSSETRFGTSSVSNGSLSRRSNEFGQRFEYRQETLNYGDFVAQVDARASSGQDLGLGFFGLANDKNSSRITLRNIGFPVTSKWFADTSVGDISSETTDALARAYRLSLGTGLVRGAGVRLFDGTSDVRAGTGRRGYLAGGPYPGFKRSQGSLSWLGYSRRLQNSVFGGVQVTRARDVTPFSFFAPTGVAGEDVSAVAASIGYGGDLFSDKKSRARLTYVRSNSSGTGGPEPRNAQGLFVEAGLRAGAYRHEFGAYSAEPNLRFGDVQLASDNRGAYWRVNTSGLRYSWGVGVDTDLQNPDQEGNLPYTRRLGVYADGQYRLNRNNSFGGALQVSFNRFAAGNAAFGGIPLPQIDRESRSVYASGYYQTRFGNWGPTRLRGTLRRNEVLVANDIAATGQEIEWEQDWISGRYETQRPELITTLGVARDRSSGTSETQPTAGVSFRLWPGVDWSLAGSLRYISRNSNLSTSRGLSGTVSSEQVLSRGWRLGAAVS